MKKTNYELLQWNHEGDSHETREVRCIIRSMPDGPMKQVLYSLYYENLNYREIGKKYKHTHGWVQYWLAKGRDYIKQQMED